MREKNLKKNIYIKYFDIYIKRERERNREREREREREGERERLGLIVKSVVFQIQRKTKTNKQNPIFFFYF